MPKMKTHKGLLKRVKITKSGKILRRRAGGSHLMSGKSAKVLRRLGVAVEIAASDKKRILRLLRNTKGAR